jgi:RNA polymerase sigma factor (TIGR02999 family)
LAEQFAEAKTAMTRFPELARRDSRISLVNFQEPRVTVAIRGNRETVAADPIPPEEVHTMADDTAAEEESRQSVTLRRRELDRIYSVAYEKVKRLAKAVVGSPSRSPVTPSTLVHAVWLKLEKSASASPESELDVRREIALAMRSVLKDAARRRSARKRGGEAIVVPFDDSLNAPHALEFVALDDALEALALLNPRQAAIVEHRFFGGFDVAEVALLLGVAKTTIERESRAAKAWLAVEVRRKS